jgi:tagatose 1,6-diphosphate aldolase GatY/KbaY
MVRRAIELGVAKFNVNTEVRAAYLRALHRSMAAVAAPDLLDLMKSAVAAMQAVVQEKLRLVGSAGRSGTVANEVATHRS